MPRLSRASMFVGTIVLACAFSPALSAQSVVQPSGVILQAAKVQAAQQKKLVFVIFMATWSQPSRYLDLFMNDKQIRPIFDKYFVPATIHVSEELGGKIGGHPEWNNFAGDSLMARLGGADKDGKKVTVPFYAIVDTDGNPLATSMDPAKEKTQQANIGYPSNPDQIAWFANMFKMAVPAMTPEESATIEGWVKKHDPTSFAPASGGGGKRGR
jgi:hypothetical protein